MSIPAACGMLLVVLATLVVVVVAVSLQHRGVLWMDQGALLHCRCLAGMAGQPQQGVQHYPLAAPC